MRVSKRRVTAEEFDSVLPQLGFAPAKIEAVRKAMVDGVPGVTVAEEYDINPTGLSISMARVWKLLGKEAPQAKEKKKAVRVAEESSLLGGLLLPPGWQQVTLVAPSSMIEKIRSEIAGLSFPAALVSKPTRKKKSNT